MEHVFLVARPAVAMLVLLGASGVVPSLAGLAVSSAVALFAAPFAIASAPAAFAIASPASLLAEVVRGAALGLAAAAPLWAASTAGGWAGQRWRGAGSPSPMAALYTAMLGVAFVAVDGPALMCAAIARSYQAAPLGAPLLADAAATLDVAGAASWVATAVRLCLPVLLAVAVAELGVAAATRAAGAAAVAWPTAALAPALVLLVTTPLLPLLVAALAVAVRRGLAP